MNPGRKFRLALGVLAALLPAGVAGAEKVAPATAPVRIISLNLCADQYLLALADRSRIAGLTQNATDPGMSAAANEAAGLRLLRQSVEEILVIDPDLVVGGSAQHNAALAAISGRAYPSLELPIADSFDDIAAQMRAVALAIGRPERGEALVRQMEQRLALLGRPGRGRVAAYYQRRGFLTGTGTLVDELMQRLGLVNLAERLGRPPLSRLSLEELVAAQPDFLLLDSATDEDQDQGTEMLQHPALSSIPRLYLPQAWTVCGGPAYVRAAESLAAQLEAVASSASVR